MLKPDLKAAVTRILAHFLDLRCVYGSQLEKLDTQTVVANEVGGFVFPAKPRSMDSSGAGMQA